MTLLLDAMAAITPRHVVLAMLFTGIVLLCEGIRQALSVRDATDAASAARLRGLQNHSTRLRHADDAPIWMKLPLVGNLPVKMRQAGLATAPQHLLAGCVLLAVVVFGTAALQTGWIVALVLSVLVALGGPTAWINHMRARRMAAFSQQLPEALEMMRRGLTVGHPLNVTIATVAREMPDPLGTEFRLLADQIAYGDTLVAAVQDMADRIAHEDLHYLSAAIAIQHGAGGNLAAVLGTLARVIRLRFSLRRRVKAISSEGRISAFILTALPFVMGGGTLIMNPDYYRGVADDPKALPLAVAVIVLVTLNGLAMRKLVTFRI